MSNAPYDRTNARHKIMVEYTAYGKPPEDIAEATGYSVQYVKGIIRSPLFQTEVAQAQQEMKSAGLKLFAEKLAEEVMPSLTTMTSVRDNTNARDTDRVTAADKIIGRAMDLYAPRNNNSEGKRSVKLVIEGGDLSTLAQAIMEVDGKQPIDVSAQRPEGGLPLALPADDDERVVPVTIDEFLAREDDERID